MEENGKSSIFNEDFYTEFNIGDSNPLENLELSEKEMELLDKLSGAKYAREKQELTERRAEIERLKEQVAVSELTHLLKWRSEMAQQMVERYLDQAGRHQHEVWFGLFDIDLLKYLNDTYGYYKSDEVLKLFAQTLNKSLRRSDTCYQFGVDEFPVLLVGIEQDNVQAVMARITSNFEAGLESLVEEGKIPRKMADESTFSGGFVKARVLEEYEERRGYRLEDGKSLFERSEQLLHKAKRNGRNSVLIEGNEKPQRIRQNANFKIETLIEDNEDLKARYSG